MLRERIETIIQKAENKDSKLSVTSKIGIKYLKEILRGDELEVSHSK
jgi:hypothetical protein